MRILLLYYFLFPHTSPSHAQATEQNLGEVFFKGRTVTWQKSYHGVWDDVIPVQMELLSDGTECKGYFYFGDSKTKYVLSGTMNQNEIRLEEQDLHSNKTGQLVVHHDKNSVTGTWYNVSKNYNAKIVMQEGTGVPKINYWVRSYISKADPSESNVILHKDFPDQINAHFFYKPFNKTLFGTSEIKDEESYSQQARLEDYLHHSAGSLHTWKVNDKRIDLRFNLGTIDYSQSMDLIQQVAITQETFADHWMAVDIKYPAIEKGNIAGWFHELIDSLLIDIQSRKRTLLSENKEADQLERLSFRMSIWPEFDLLNTQWMTGTMHIKNSWEENTASVPFMFDIKKGNVVQYNDLFNDLPAFEILKSKWITQELNKLKTSSSLEYEKLTPDDFNLLSIKQEGLAFSAPFDLVYGTRQIIIPYSAIKDQLSTRYFPL